MLLTVGDGYIENNHFWIFGTKVENVIVNLYACDVLFHR